MSAATLDLYDLALSYILIGTVVVAVVFLVLKWPSL